MRAAAVIFDLDGTITEPCLDFDVIRSEIGLPTEPRTPILESLAAMSLADRTRAEAILHRHEEAAALASELRDSAAEVIATLRARYIPIGLLTRNSRYCTELVLRRHSLQFDHIHTREDGRPKPSPEPVLEMCRRWSVDPARTWVVGDYLFDVQAGHAAGARTALIVGDGALPPFAGEADHVIRSLRELIPLCGIA